MAQVLVIAKNMLRWPGEQLDFSQPSHSFPHSVASVSSCSKFLSPYPLDSMLSCLSALKSRLAIPDLTVDFDDLLTTALTALSARSDSATNPPLSRPEHV